MTADDLISELETQIRVLRGLRDDLSATHACAVEQRQRAERLAEVSAIRLAKLETIRDTLCPMSGETTVEAARRVVAERDRLRAENDSVDTDGDEAIRKAVARAENAEREAAEDADRLLSLRAAIDEVGIWPSGACERGDYEAAVRYLGSELVRVTQERNQARSEVRTLRAKLSASDPDALPEPPVGCRWAGHDLMYGSARLGYVYSNGEYWAWCVSRRSAVAARTRRAAAEALIAAVGGGT